MNIFTRICRYFTGAPTFASITAGMPKTIDQLEAHAAEQAQAVFDAEAAIDALNEQADAAAQEIYLANVTSRNLKALIQPAEGPVV